MTTPFRKGDLLVIAPHDEDDPVALALAGERVSFVRYAQNPADGDHAVVRMAGNWHHGEQARMRHKDLRHASEVTR